MQKVICMGEALIDFMPLENGKSLKDVANFTKACGGAPTNVCASVAKLGEKAIILTQVGADSFGDYIVDVLRKVGVDTTHLIQNSKYKTSLAFAALDAQGERSFMFYRDNAADLFLQKEDIKKELFDRHTIFHFGSVSLVPSLAKEAHIKALQYAQQAQSIISFDPNLRFNLWPSAENLKTTVLEFILGVDILKLADDEAQFLFPNWQISEIKNYVFAKGVKWLIISKGAAGLSFYRLDLELDVKPICVEAVDTTGAGDSLIGAILALLCEKNISKDDLLKVNVDIINEILVKSAIYAAHTVTKKGAIPALATKIEIEEFAKRYKLI